MINIKKPRVVNLYGVKDGSLLYVCSCGRLASEPLKSFNKFTRCPVCTKANKELVKRDIVVEEGDLKNLFMVMLKNGLYTYVSLLGLGDKVK